jgi:hypothetical protein
LSARLEVGRLLGDGDDFTGALGAQAQIPRAVKGRLRRRTPMATRGRPRTFDPDTTVVQGLSVQARDGATRAELEAGLTCSMAAGDSFTSGHTGV